MSLEETRAIALEMKERAKATAQADKVKAEAEKARRQVELIKLRKEGLREALQEFYGIQPDDK